MERKKNVYYPRKLLTAAVWRRTTKANPEMRLENRKRLNTRFLATRPAWKHDEQRASKLRWHLNGLVLSSCETRDSINNLTLIKTEIQSRYSQTRKIQAGDLMEEAPKPTRAQKPLYKRSFSPCLTITIKNGNWRPVYSNAQ